VAHTQTLELSSSLVMVVLMFDKCVRRGKYPLPCASTSTFSVASNYVLGRIRRGDCWRSETAAVEFKPPTFRSNDGCAKQGNECIRRHCENGCNRRQARKG